MEAPEPGGVCKVAVVLRTHDTKFLLAPATVPLTVLDFTLVCEAAPVEAFSRQLTIEWE